MKAFEKRSPRAAILALALLVPLNSCASTGKRSNPKKVSSLNPEQLDYMREYMQRFTSDSIVYHCRHVRSFELLPEGPMEKHLAQVIRSGEGPFARNVGGELSRKRSKLADQLDGIAIEILTARFDEKLSKLDQRRAEDPKFTRSAYQAFFKEARSHLDGLNPKRVRFLRDGREWTLPELESQLMTLTAEASKESAARGVRNIFRNEEYHNYREVVARLKQYAGNNKVLSDEEFTPVLFAAYAEFLDERVLGQNGELPEDPMAGLERSRVLLLAIEFLVGTRHVLQYEAEVRGFLDEDLVNWRLLDREAQRWFYARHGEGNRLVPERKLKPAEREKLRAFVENKLDPLFTRDKPHFDQAEVERIALANQQQLESNAAEATRNTLAVVRKLLDMTLEDVLRVERGHSPREAVELTWRLITENGLSRADGIPAVRDALDRALQGPAKALSSQPEIALAVLEELLLLRADLEPRDGVEGTELHPLVGLRLRELERTYSQSDPRAAELFAQLHDERQNELELLAKVPDWSLVAFSWTDPLNEQKNVVEELRSGLSSRLEEMGLNQTQMQWQARAHFWDKIERARDEVRRRSPYASAPVSGEELEQLKQVYGSSVGAGLQLDDLHPNPTKTESWNALEEDLKGLRLAQPILEQDLLEYMERALDRLQETGTKEDVRQQLKWNARICEEMLIDRDEAPEVDAPIPRTYDEIRQDLRALR